MLVNILSDNGSNSAPNLETTLNFLAKYPSKKSLNAPNMRQIIAQMFKLYFKVYTNNGDIKILKILKQFGTILIKFNCIIYQLNYLFMIYFLNFYKYEYTNILFIII